MVLEVRILIGVVACRGPGVAVRSFVLDASLLLEDYRMD
jgi:hypothetical protein